MNRDQATAAMLAAGGKGAYVSREAVESLIVSERYHVVPGTTTTVCCLTLANGHVEVSQSGCIDPANFNEQIGRERARTKAVDRIHDLQAYAYLSAQHQAK